MIAAPPRLGRHYAKLCDVADFDDPALRARIREIVPGLRAEEELHRKNWEYATLALFLEDVGLLNDDAEILSVGAGHEEVLFWLANRVGRVVATDIYGRGAFSGREAEASMLDDPSSFAPYPYREDRLEVLEMDARQVAFEDRSFDVVFSLSSIEHFGGLEDIRRASREIGRVVKPGGYAYIVTECYLGRHPLDSPIVQTAAKLLTGGRKWPTASLARRTDDVFTLRELRRLIVEPSRLELLQDVKTELSEASRRNIIRFGPAGTWAPSTGRAWPHVVIQARGAPWTSVALPLWKRP